MAKHSSNIRSHSKELQMITCHLRYILDPTKIKEFEHYGKIWIPLVKKFGGMHHGYLLPSEGASNIALASFSFPTLVPPWPCGANGA